ncbi:MAG: histidine kinase [Synergistaceae bacterium]|jgi:two-component system sensor histidine kinase DegS|nr:histidine kinase [Synergistaceae bacterium]
MTDKIAYIEKRISRSLQDNLDELCLLGQKEAGRFEDVRERAHSLVLERRDMAAAIDKAVRDYEQSRAELLLNAQRGNREAEKISYERASELMKIRSSLEERYRLLGLQRDELAREERHLERVTVKCEKMCGRLRLALTLLSATDDFAVSDDAARTAETMLAAFQMAEREAATFARELHDGPAQTFSAVGLMLEMCGEYLGRSEYQAAGEEAERALEQTRRGLSEIRSFLFSLSPTGIQDGFEIPMKRLATQLRQTWGCKLTYTLDGNLDQAPVSVRTGVFKTLHQAAVNAARHGAAEVRVSVRYVQKALRVRVTDNGSGFDVERERAAAKERGSYGIINMEERVKMLGGKISITSAPSKGSTVSFSVPIL